MKTNPFIVTQDVLSLQMPQPRIRSIENAGEPRLQDIYMPFGLVYSPGASFSQQSNLLSTHLDLLPLNSAIGTDGGEDGDLDDDDQNEDDEEFEEDEDLGEDDGSDGDDSGDEDEFDDDDEEEDDLEQPAKKEIDTGEDADLVDDEELDEEEDLPAPDEEADEEDDDDLDEDYGSDWDEDDDDDDYDDDDDDEFKPLNPYLPTDKSLNSLSSPQQFSPALSPIAIRDEIGHGFIKIDLT